MGLASGGCEALMPWRVLISEMLCAFCRGMAQSRIQALVRDCTLPCPLPPMPTTSHAYSMLLPAMPTPCCALPCYPAAKCTVPVLCRILGPESRVLLQLPATQGPLYLVSAS